MFLAAVLRDLSYLPAGGTAADIRRGFDTDSAGMNPQYSAHSPSSYEHPESRDSYYSVLGRTAVQMKRVGCLYTSGASGRTGSLVVENSGNSDICTTIVPEGFLDWFCL